MTRSRWPRVGVGRVCLAKASPSVRRSAILMSCQVEACWPVHGVGVFWPHWSHTDCACCAAGIHQGFDWKSATPAYCAPLLE